ncbi:MAG TPA: TonB-dependent receptor [Gemmatimonadaceae bacterium]|nr:TonB-dependent receptor [Gemmatimonadaceae bacterium]
MRNPSSSHLAVILAVALAPGASLAAQEQSRDTTSLSPVVVTATKVPVATAASTAATTVVSGADLRARGAVTLLDALRTVPGVALGRTSGPGSQTSIFLRGGNSNFTKILIDGVPLNAPGGAVDLGAFTTDDVERIEIVRGPASVLYGSDAMTGVVQIFTRRRDPASAAFRMANRDRQYDATVSAARETTLDATTRVRGSAAAGYHAGDGFLPFNNRFRNAVASAGGELAGERGNASLSASYSDARYHYPTDGGGDPVDSNAYTGSNRLSLSAIGLWRASERLSTRLQLGRAALLGNSADLPDSPGDAGGYYSRSHTAATRQFADVQLVASLPRAVTMLAGGALEAQRARSRGWSEYANFGSTSNFNRSRTNRALYAQLTGGSRALSLDAGARAERLRGDRVAKTYRVGAATELVPATVIRASAATAFKEPAFDELFDTGFSTGEPGLRPERNRSREVGAETRLASGLLTLGATYFDQRFRDLVQYRYIAPGVSNYYNVLAATSRGLELEARIAGTRGFASRGSYTLQRTRVTNPGNGSFGSVEEGKPLLRRPRRTATIDASYQRPRGSLFATLTRTGARDDYDYNAGLRRRLAPYTLIDAAAELPLRGRTTGTHSLLLTLRGENLGDAKYQSVYGYATQGRTLYLGLRASVTATATREGAPR